MSGSRSIVHFPAGRTAGKSEARYRTEERDLRRRGIRPGYPIEGKLRPDEVLRYLDDDPMVCLLCGRGFQVLGQHLTMLHGVPVREYCEMYGIPYRFGGGKGLATKTNRQTRKRSALANPGVMERARHLHEKSGHTGYQSPISEIYKAVHRAASKIADRVCPACGQTFQPSRGLQSYCSKRCSGRIRGQKARAAWHRCPDCGDVLSSGSQSNGVARCRPCHFALRRAKARKRRAG